LGEALKNQIPGKLDIGSLEAQRSLDENNPELLIFDKSVGPY
jgi:hypothetical protein